MPKPEGSVSMSGTRHIVLTWKKFKMITQIHTLFRNILFSSNSALDTMYREKCRSYSGGQPLGSYLKGYFCFKPYIATLRETSFPP